MSRWRIILTIVLLLYLAASVAGQEDLEDGQKQLANGIAALKAGDLVSAEKTFLLALKQGIKTPLVYHNLGIIAQRHGRNEDAVERFREALALQPDYGPSHLLLGVSLMAMRKDTDAARELRTAARLMPSEPQAHLQLARACESMGDEFGAVEQYQRLVQLAPQEAEYVYLLGRSWGKLSQSSLQKIATLNPNAARLHQALGQEYWKQGKYGQAVASYEKAATVDPKLPEIHLAISLIYLQQKKYDQALSEVERELSIVPESRAALTAKASIEAAKAASNP